MGSGLLILFLIAVTSDTLAIYGVLSGLVYFVCVHVLRKRNERFNRMYLESFKFLLRPHEVEGLPGAFYFLLGTLLSLLFFEKPIAVLSILFLSVGDPCASLCGIYFKSRVFMEGKSVSGTLGCGIACTVAALIYKAIYLNSLEIDYIEEMQIIPFAALCFIVSILAEIGPNSRKHYLDDNLTIPLYASALLTIYFKVLAV